MRNRRIVLAYLFVLLLTATCLAQVTTGQINGTVTDQSGAVLVDAKVTATNTATSLNRSSVTNDTGFYVIPQLPPGPYEIKIEHSGFSAATQKNIQLGVGQQATLDFHLKPGAASE